MSLKFALNTMCKIHLFKIKDFLQKLENYQEKLFY